MRSPVTLPVHPVQQNAPDCAQAEEDALLGPEADGGSRQPPRRRMARSRLDSPSAALASAHRVHRSLHGRTRNIVIAHCSTSLNVLLTLGNALWVLCYGRTNSRF